MEVSACVVYIIAKYRDLVNNSHSIAAGFKRTNVVCPHNGTYDLCIFAIVLRT